MKPNMERASQNANKCKYAQEQDKSTDWYYHKRIPLFHGYVIKNRNVKPMTLSTPAEDPADAV
jgi:hypothetical protein